MISLSRSHPGRGQKEIHLVSVQGCCQVERRLAGGQPGCGVACRPTGPASPSGRHWLPGYTLTHLACVLQRLPGPAWLWLRDRQVAGRQPGRGQQAGPSPAWPHGGGPASVTQGVTNQVFCLPAQGSCSPGIECWTFCQEEWTEARSSWERGGHIPGRGGWGRGS